VQPVSTPLFLLGYALALPIGMRLGQMVAQRNRLALVGHQFGVGLALLGWLLRGSTVLVVAHLVWLVGAKLWFEAGVRRQTRA
jgi:hypothetical protein